MEEEEESSDDEEEESVPVVRKQDFLNVEQEPCAVQVTLCTFVALRFSLSFNYIMFCSYSFVFI